MNEYSGYTATLGATTCFGPICWPSSCCNLTYRAAIQDVWGAFGGIGWGERDLVFSLVVTMT